MLQTTKQEQIQEWSKLYGRQVSNEGYEEICYNLNGFFTTLKTWDDEERKMCKNGQTANSRN